MKVLAPGSILQNLYIKKRIRKWKIPFSFIEIGSGVGLMSKILLKQGGHGIGFDLNERACSENIRLNNSFIKDGRYKVINSDFLSFYYDTNVDVVVSMMVIEHMSPDDLSVFLKKCKSVLKKDGLLIFFVPASNKYWGIEDEIAGHYKRYVFNDFRDLSSKFTFSVNHLVGLTFPISNILFPLSNFLIKNSESYKLNLSKKEKTILSGKRDVPFKTNFPNFMSFLLNEYTLLPFHWMQVLFAKNPNSMVIYCELKND